MKGGIFGFSRKEVLWFTAFFIVSLGLMVYSAIRLVSKYYNHNTETYALITKKSHDLWSLQDITLYAVNAQRSSLNLIIYANNQKEFQINKASAERNRDSLSRKLRLLETENHLDVSSRESIEKAGMNYLELNSNFIKMACDTAIKGDAEAYNVSTVRPELRKFTDLTRETGKLLTQEIQQLTKGGLGLFSQVEFWLLVITLLPYMYFFFRFMYLVVKMILWDIKS